VQPKICKSGKYLFEMSTVVNLLLKVSMVALDLHVGSWFHW